jgi:pyruvate/2-oxoglutarate dehydrogenase complex dihydrolipoamide acyltransferase (E2) component
MSPTMTEGAIHSWKVKEGEAFSATDVLLELASLRV